jgi:hypothetical protein
VTAEATAEVTAGATAGSVTANPHANSTQRAPSNPPITNANKPMPIGNVQPTDNSSDKPLPSIEVDETQQINYPGSRVAVEIPVRPNPLERVHRHTSGQTPGSWRHEDLAGLLSDSSASPSLLPPVDDIYGASPPRKTRGLQPTRGARQHSTRGRRGASSIRSRGKTPSGGRGIHGQTGSTSQYSSRAVSQDFDTPDNNLGTGSRGKHKDKDEGEGEDEDEGEDGQPKEQSRHRESWHEVSDHLYLVYNLPPSAGSFLFRSFTIPTNSPLLNMFGSVPPEHIQQGAVHKRLRRVFDV